MRITRTQMATAFLVGSAIGATSALLFAPVSGRRMRRILRREANHCLNLVSTKSREIQGQYQNLVSSAARFLKNNKIASVR
jgi:gas vesicle protein